MNFRPLSIRFFLPGTYYIPSSRFDRPRRRGKRPGKKRNCFHLSFQVLTFWATHANRPACISKRNAVRTCDFRIILQTRSCCDAEFFFLLGVSLLYGCWWWFSVVFGPTTDKWKCKLCGWIRRHISTDDCCGQKRAPKMAKILSEVARVESSAFVCSLQVVFSAKSPSKQVLATGRTIILHAKWSESSSKIPVVIRNSTHSY